MLWLTCTASQSTHLWCLRSLSAWVLSTRSSPSSSEGGTLGRVTRGDPGGVDRSPVTDPGTIPSIQYGSLNPAARGNGEVSGVIRGQSPEVMHRSATTRCQMSPPPNRPLAESETRQTSTRRGLVNIRFSRVAMQDMSAMHIHTD